MTTDPAFKEPVSHALMTQIMLQLQCHFQAFLDINCLYTMIIQTCQKLLRNVTS